MVRPRGFSECRTERPSRRVWTRSASRSTFACSDAVIVPIVYAKALIYRPSTLTDVYFDQAYQADNYAVMGLAG
jgi:hypothetical protein